jgi:hypothetical protein
MRTFKQWAEENHPEDDVLNESLVDLARKAANIKPVRAAITAGALALGAGPTAVKGAMPELPSMDGKDGFSSKPFNRNIGPRPEGFMSDYDLYYYQVERVAEFLRDRQIKMNMGRQVVEPRWYLPMVDEYEGKRPRPPKFSEREQAYAKYMNDPKNSDEQKQRMTSFYNSTR